MKDTNIVNVRFSREELENLDLLVSRNGYKSRSTYIKSLLNDAMRGIPNDVTRAAVLEILRNDEEVRAVFQELTQQTMHRVIDGLIGASNHSK